MIAVKCMSGCELCWSGALHIKSVSRLKMSIQRHFLLENGNSTMSTVTFAFGKKIHVGSNSGRSRNFVEPGLISQQLRPTASLTQSASPPYDNVRNSLPLHNMLCNFVLNFAHAIFCPSACGLPLAEPGLVPMFAGP